MELFDCFGDLFSCYVKLGGLQPVGNPVYFVVLNGGSVWYYIGELFIERCGLVYIEYGCFVSESDSWGFYSSIVCEWCVCGPNRPGDVLSKALICGSVFACLFPG